MQIASRLPNRIVGNLAAELKIQTRSFSAFSHVLAMLYAHLAYLLSMNDVCDDLCKKLIVRHPHVFGDKSAANEQQALQNWDAVKMELKQQKSQTEAMNSVSRALPALMRSEKVQRKSAKVGFDWDEIAPVWDKIREEVEELKEAQLEGDPKHIEEELGDVLFTVVNLARFLKVDSELALMNTNKKFTKRFHYVEKKVKESGKKWSEFTLN